ncbi:MAG: hypothetical protein ACHQAQ_03680 [Hyphomicrobiales bacterium]
MESYISTPGSGDPESPRAAFCYRRLDLNQKRFAPSGGGLTTCQSAWGVRMVDTSNDLMLKCVAATRDGADFPTVWDTVLRPHALVLGPPIQTYRNDLPHLEIQLISGQRLVYNSSSKEYFVV